MEKVEVDPKLFVTCRLCLEDMGIYQIIPNIQHQIKYCFDIDVAPFDGLPQLICKKCELKLSEYFTIKTAYVAKQKFLISTLQNKNGKNIKLDDALPEITTLVTSQAQDDPEEKQPDAALEESANSAGIAVCEELNKESSPPVTYQKSSKRKRIRIESTSSDSSESKSDGTKVKPIIIKKKKSSTRRKWHSANYNKHFYCKLCNKSYVKKNYLLKHFASVHSTCFKKYKYILNSLCKVNIEKVDSKPNFTGVNNAVVLSKDKVVVNDHSSKYYIVYTSKSQNLPSNEFQARTNINEISDFSDDAEYSVSKKKRNKRLRLLSSDTVVIEKKDDNDKMSSEAEDPINNGLKNNKRQCEIITEFINLDSDSEAETETASENKNADSINEDNENKLIRNVIDVCHSKYIRNIAIEKTKRPNYAHIETQLMHKVLNLGRKIINRQGLNCTGLLRFLEYRNLGVIWLPKTCHTFSGPPVRISMTTSKKDHQRPEDSEVGWVKIPCTFNMFKIDSNSGEKLIPAKEPNEKDSSVGLHLRNGSSDIVLNIKTSKENNTVTCKIQNEKIVNIPQEHVSPWQAISDQACLYKFEDTTSGGKILNKNPVANPKQLPKKVVHYENKPNKSVLEKDVGSELQPEINDQETLLFTEPVEAENDLTGMPIITSTTSLASDYHPFDNVINGNNSESLSAESANSNLIGTTESVPRIKVKPVSELMPENISTSNNLLLNQNNISHYDQRLPNMTQFIQQMPYQNVAPSVSIIQMPVTAVDNVVPENQKRSSEFFILDTFEMPNTRTTSPFQYLKTLLEIHGIKLIEHMDSNHFHSLIKFKVLFKQEAVKPIVLCLSLHCNANRFYIGIKDSSNINIYVQNLSSNWQWEIIKIFQGDVCNKIYQTALKIGLEVHDISKKFLCLVKSIKIKKIDV